MEFNEEKYKYFAKLYFANAILDEKAVYIRDYQIISEINDMLREFEENNFIHSYEMYSHLAYISSNIILLQPFWDGNHRAMIYYILNYLKENKYIYSSKNKLTSKIKLPFIYDENECISSKDIMKFNKSLNR